ncbi:MAG TPA: Flp family type IVb pilin [Trinickia sp.]|jgi:pilus assembly protein Flp/PilA|nr:Flp family type IVb pilin [Trinickia sp.]
MNKLQGFVRCEDGAASIEYALLAGLIALVIVVSATAVGNSLQGLFAAVSAGLGLAA